MEPNFIIVGSQKAGTSSLFDYLLYHPQVIRSLTKEIHYFDLNYHLGQQWYRAHFATKFKAPRLSRHTNKPYITGEASPYYLFHPNTPTRIAEAIPSVKLIFLFRDPVDRAYSHFKHNHRRGHETFSFDEAIAMESKRIGNDLERMIKNPTFNSPAVQHYSYRARGIYADQVTRYLEHFPREQCLFLCSEHMFADPAKTLATVENFLCIDHFTPTVLKPSNQGGYIKKDDHSNLFQELSEFYRPHNHRLFEIVGETYPWCTCGDGI